MKLESIFQYRNKIKTAEELVQLLMPRPRDKKVIMCNGVFDIVHPGHLRHLIYAKSKGDILVVSITADEHITKGTMRPHVPEQLRAINLAAFEMVDYVIVDRDPTPVKNLKIIQPDYFAKGYEYFSNGTNPKTTEEIQVLESYGGEIIFTPGDIVYSSSQFIELSPPKITEDKLIILMDSEGLTFDHLRDALNSFTGTKVHVVGDSIVDSFTHCTVIGGMHNKTPTMSVRYENKQDFTGGAAIVAKHLKAAGADVVFSTILGEDHYKKHILDDLKSFGIRCLPIIDKLRPTTNKNAFIVDEYRMLKVDTVDNRCISEKVVQELMQQISQTPAESVIFSDFRHGIFNAKTIPHLTSAIPADVYRVADSQVASRWGNILDFTGFDLITPNEKEARFSLGDQDSVIRHLGSDLFKRSKAKTLFLKLGDRGVIVFRNRPEAINTSFFLDSLAERAVDPVGAGDALLAYSTLAMIRTKNEAIAAILGSLAAAVECEYNGNIPVTPKNILAKMERIERRIQYQT